MLKILCYVFCYWCVVFGIVDKSNDIEEKMKIYYFWEAMKKLLNEKWWKRKYEEEDMSVGQYDNEENMKNILEKWLREEAKWREEKYIHYVKVWGREIQRNDYYMKYWELYILNIPHSQCL